MRSDLKQTQLQKELRIFGLNQQRYALYDEEVFVDFVELTL